ncbi:MAG TPA: acyl-CoA dehydrogenase family protein [Stellaceae bacterium]|nr:acyl-CoA dehydrogenase family protein [Stellaceae bacterium]
MSKSARTALVEKLTPEERALLAAATQFRQDRIAPNAAAWERSRQPPREAIREAAHLGLTGIEAPRDKGGQGAGFVAKTLIAEELATSCMAFAFSLINTQNVAAHLARNGTPAQIERYLAPLLSGESVGGIALTEPHAGSDFPAITTMARKVAGGWVLDGEKAWLTNAAVADVVMVYAKTEQASGTAGIAAFLVDAHAPGFERLPPYALMGGHAIGVGGIRLSGYRAGEDALLYKPGEAFKRALGGINGARTYVAAMCCGMVEAALRCALDRATRRHAFGQRLLDHQGLRWALAEIATDLEAARLLAYRAAELIERGEDAILAASFAKKFGARMAQQRLGDCLQAMGAEGLREEYPIGRHIACARIAGFVDGSSEIQNERIGALLEKSYL